MVFKLLSRKREELFVLGMWRDSEGCGAQNLMLWWES